MNKKVLIAICILYWNTLLVAQYKYDNTLYHTVYLEDLPHALKQSGHHLLLDVRSPGEYNDTSMYDNLNIGRLKGSKNITIRELDKRLNEIQAYKTDPVFLYCSHSQRSRRAGKLLRDSGFTNVINVNGGMTEFHLIKDNSKKLNSLFEKNTFFNLVSPESAYKLITSKKQLTILDVRSDSSFMSLTNDEKVNSFGKINGSIHIPLADLKTKLTSIPKTKPVLLVDAYGDESIIAAAILHEHGIKVIQVLFNGMDEWVYSDNFNGKEKVWEQSNAFGFISSVEFDTRMRKNPPPCIIDIRTNDEFNNQDKVMTYHNRGHIQNAINIPEGELSSRLNELEKYKSSEVIVYGLSSAPEAFGAAKYLANQGFKSVKVLTGGIWDLRWKAANNKGLSRMMSWVVDVPEDNL
ncbi:MAG: rhodanese-like domain-containing protein [Saprospiraceae bacterium]